MSHSTANTRSLHVIFASFRCCVLVLSGIAAHAADAPLATLVARAVESDRNDPIVDAQLTIGGRTVPADQSGNFRPLELAQGRYPVTITAPGHRSLETTITLTPGLNNPPAFALESEIVQLEKLVVKEQAASASTVFADKTGLQGLGEILSGKALENKVAQSASELLKDTAGVTVTNAADGATNVSVRGLDSRFVRVTVDGQRQGGRGNALDNLPPEIVKSLEVAKALMPDQDADAIGGSINVTTQSAEGIKAPYWQGRHQITYAPIEPRPGTRQSLTYARPLQLFAEKNNGGLLIAATFDDQYRRRDNNETDDDWPSLVSPGPAPYAGQLVPAYTRSRVEVTKDHRRRASLLSSVDARFGVSTVSFRTNYTHEETTRVRQRERFDVAEGTPVVLAPTLGEFSGVHLDRREQQQTTDRDALSLALSGKTERGPIQLDGATGLVFTRENEPHTLDTVFRSDRNFRTRYDMTGDPMRPNFSFVDETNSADLTSINDPGRYFFNSFTLATVDNRDREMSARLNATYNFDHTATPAFLKFGVKTQERRRSAAADRVIFGPAAAALPMIGLVRTASVTTDDGRYSFGPIPSTSAVANLLATSPQYFLNDPLETRIAQAAGDYSVTETVSAAYVMARVHFSAWSATGGVRGEKTRVTGEANQLIFDASGTLHAIVPVGASTSYQHVLPSLHLRYDARPGLVVRGSVTHALARPAYTDMLPTRQFNFVDRRTQAGNPALRPYESTNFDLSVDAFSERHGLFSVAAFAKTIDHFIAETQAPVTIGDLGEFLERRRINGSTARVAGVEANWKGQAHDLPAGLGKATLGASYTWLQSSAHLPDRPGENLPLPGQSRNLFALSLQYERGPFSMDLATRYRTDQLDSVVAPRRDVYRRGALELEFSLARKIGKTTRVQFSISNLNNAPQLLYSGDRQHLKEIEDNGPEMSLGVQWKM
jgi:TonB-dependent receptor